MSASGPTGAMVTDAVRAACLVAGVDASAMEATGGCHPRQGERLTRALEIRVWQASKNGRAQGFAATASGGDLLCRGCAHAAGMIPAGTEVAGSTN